MANECTVQPLELQMVHGPTNGARILEEVALARSKHLGVTSGGIYNRRMIRGSHQWSLHAVGRAIDLMHHDPAVLKLLAVHVIARASRLGVCEVIGPAGRWAYNATVDTRPRADHQNHVHIGVMTGFANSRVRHDEGVFLVGCVWDGPSDVGT